MTVILDLIVFSHEWIFLSPMATEATMFFKA